MKKATRNPKSIRSKNLSKIVRDAARIICDVSEDHQDAFRFNPNKMPKVLKDHDFLYIMQFGFPPEPHLSRPPEVLDTVEDLKGFL